MDQVRRLTTSARSGKEVDFCGQIRLGGRLLRLIRYRPLVLDQVRRSTSAARTEKGDRALRQHIRKVLSYGYSGGLKLRPLVVICSLIFCNCILGDELIQKFDTKSLVNSFVIVLDNFLMTFKKCSRIQNCHKLRFAFSEFFSPKNNRIQSKKIVITHQLMFFLTLYLF